MTDKTSRPTVVVTDRRYSEPAQYSDGDSDPYAEAIADAGGEIVYGDFESHDEIVDGCRHADVVMSLKAPISRQVIENLENARLIFRNGAGFDNVDIEAATDHGIPVSVAKGYANDELSEHAIALMLAAARGVTARNRAMREENGWGERAPIQPMGGKTLGVVGLGEIGRALVPKARGIGMDVVAADPYASQFTFDALDAERVDFDELLERADAISIHCQLTSQTHHMFSTAEFETMKETAVLVNTARGPIVDETALVEAVEAGEILGAGLDTYEIEPPADSPALTCDRIVCTPHHGVFCQRAQNRKIQIGIEEIVRALEGRPLQNVVNPEALKYGSGLINPELDSWK